jgi:competence protein ComEC
MDRMYTMYIVACGFGLGICASVIDLGPFIASIFLSVISTLLLVSCYSADLFIKNGRYTIIGCTFILLFSGSIGYGYTTIRDYVSSHDPRDRFLGKAVAIEVIVATEPQVREKDIKYIVRAQKINEEYVGEFSVVAVGSVYPSYTYGDLLKVRGTLALPQDFADSTFNYIGYLKKDGIRYILHNATFEKIASGKGNTVMHWLFRIKNTFIGSTENVFPAPEAALGAGLVIGAKKMTKDAEKEMRIAGVIHMVVLSGYNITIIVQSLMYILSFLGRKARFMAGLSGIFLFALLTGASATVVRASIMAMLVLFAEIMRRDYDVLRALVLAGLGMLIWNPLLLLYDPSFQLSFMATLGLLLISPYIEKILLKIKVLRGDTTLVSAVRGILSTTIATQIAVLPLILRATGDVSVVGVIANLCIVPFVPITMLGVAVSAMVSIVTAPLGGFFEIISGAVSMPTGLLLSYELSVIHFFAKLPFAILHIQAFSLWAVWVSYALYAIVLYILTLRMIAKNKTRV